MIQKLQYISYSIIGYLLSFNLLFADNADGIFGDISKDDVKKGNIHIDDIPKILRTTIDILFDIAGTIAIIFIIIGAYKILFGSLTSEKTKGKDTIIMALTGFAIASLAWFIIKFIIDNFS